MDLAWISLAALLIVIVVSCTTTVNPGFLSVALAWLIGVYFADWFGTPLGLKIVMSGFPSDLFLTLVGVTLLFTQAQDNGTLWGADGMGKSWVTFRGGDGGFVMVNPKDPNEVYSNYVYLSLDRSTDGGSSASCERSNQLSSARATHACNKKTQARIRIIFYELVSPRLRPP